MKPVRHAFSKSLVADEFPWTPSRQGVCSAHVRNSNDSPVDVGLIAYMDRGFEVINGHRTCYRRNCFYLSCWLFVQEENQALLLLDKTVKGFGVSVSAVVDDQEAADTHRPPVRLSQWTEDRETTSLHRPGIVQISPSD